MRHLTGWAMLALLLGPCPLVPADENPFLVGEFTVEKVVDGDTIHVTGLNESVRFLCIDTEECSKGSDAPARVAAMTRDYASYVKGKTRSDPFAKFETPMGWEAKRFAQEWFPEGSTVRIEIDSVSRRTGYYGRVLGYVFAKRNNKWINYNVACVRAGMSPYFEKYGRSERFEAEFIAAERDARIHGRGIWSPYAMGYPNYDARIGWWSRRSEAMALFEARYGNRLDAVSVMNEDDWSRLDSLAGKKTILFGAFHDAGGLFELAHRHDAHAAVLFANDRLLDAVRRLARSVERDFALFEGTLVKGFEHEGRAYQYMLEVADARCVFVELADPARGTVERRFPLVLPEDHIHWTDAADHMGKVVSLVGEIVATKNIGKLTFLNFDRDFRNTLTVVIAEESYARFDEPPERAYKSHKVHVRGTITEHEGAPQVVITGPHQIEILV